MLDPSKAELRRWWTLGVLCVSLLVITVDTTVQEAPMLPTVAIAGHKKLKGVTNIVLDHERAAVLALTHLKNLHHERIAFMKGNPVSSDAKAIPSPRQA